MGISEHYSGGRVERMVVTIVTVDPANDRIEGVGRDGAVIQISAGHVSGFFRMPYEREQWVIVRQNGIWTLESVIELDIWTKKKRDLQMSEALITASRVYLGTGQQLATTDTTDALDERLGALEYRPIVTTLPTLPVDGQEIRFQNAAMETTGIVWTFRYRAGSSSAHKWEFVGGPPLWDDYRFAISQSQAGSVWFGFGATDPTVTVPLAGDYQIEHGATMYHSIAAARDEYVGIKIGATEPSVATGIAITSADSARWGTASERFVATDLSAGTVLLQRYQHAAGETPTIHRRAASLSVRPVRVG